MLQIVTGMYFKQGVPLNERTHRAVFYTNGGTLSADPVELPVGRFLFSSTLSAVIPVTIEVDERLEAVGPDGESETLISTGGAEILNDAATVYAFALNITCHRNQSMVERLVPSELASTRGTQSSTTLRRTFDPRVFLQPDELEEASQFCSRLLELNRRYFEAAMRAIRRVVDATYIVGEDPSLAYTLYVAALESLALIATSPEETRSWDTYDGEKRKIIDSAITELNHEQAQRVRDAVLQIDQLSLARRFRSFTLNHVEPSFYRSEAQGASHPIRALDLPNALAVAYRLRSRNVHELESLAPELWMISDRADTLSWEDSSVLSLEGLNRLCRHVIRVFVERSPTELDAEFKYRDHLPGIVRVQFAPEYWIWKAAGFSLRRAPSVLEGFVELLLRVPLESQEPLPVDLSDVLEAIEKALPGLAKPESRLPMVAIYVLWHALLDEKHHRPKAEEFLERFQSDLDSPSAIGFVVRVLTSHEIEWSDDELLDLAEGRRDELVRGAGQPLPARLDAALFLWAAQRFWKSYKSRALNFLSLAMESVPGDESVMALEEAASRGEMPVVHLVDFVFMAEPSPEDSSDPLEGGVPDATEAAQGDASTATQST